MLLLVLAPAAAHSAPPAQLSPPARLPNVGLWPMLLKKKLVMVDAL